MAIITCIECGKEFSDKASACPNCACPTDVVLKSIEESGVAPNKAVTSGTSKPTRVSILLNEAGPSKVGVIKAVRELTGLGLIEAKNLVDNAPINIVENISQKDAEEMMKILLLTGAVVEIVNYLETPSNSIESHSIASYSNNKAFQDPSIICPKCGSNRYEVISATSKGVHWVLWGPLGAGKILSKYKCKNCNHNY
jgi:ribosomal protein L7/L12